MSRRAAFRSAFARAAVVEQMLVGIATALLVALADGIVCIARPVSPRVGPVEMATAIVHLVGLYLPPGLIGGLLAGVSIAALRRVRSLDPLRTRLRTLRGWFRSDPKPFGELLALGVVLVGLFALVRTAAVHFATRYHRIELSSYALAAIVIASLVLALPLWAALARGAHLLGRLLGPLGSPGMLLVGTFVGVTVLVAAWIARGPRLLELYDVEEIAWLPGTAAVYLLVAIVVRSRITVHGVRRVRRITAAATVLGLVAHGVSAATYGRSSRVRSVVEQRSVAGKFLLRRYVAVTDRDGDGFAWLWGGGDCDDGRADVYPGAADPVGDGIDADCFDGDGSPRAVDQGRGAYGRRPPGLDRPNVLLVLIDALRPDHLGVHGYRRPTSPRIDAFAAGAVRFERAYAQSSRSLRSIPSMMTGMYPTQIGFGPEYLWPTLLDENVTLAERLREHGWATAVVMGTDYFARVAGFFQGFDDVWQSPLYRPPRDLPVTEGIERLRRLQSQQRPWFLWVHLFNVHEEYLWDGIPSRFGPTLVDRYDTEITIADHEVGRMLDALERSGEADRTVVIVASDHGEAFGEHGHRGHASTLYEEEVRSVLLVRAPGIAPRTVRERVGLFDLMPTVLNLAGIEVPRPMPARSLLPLMTGEGTHPPERLLVAELMPDGLFPFDVKALWHRDEKLHWWVREGRYQLFDLRVDPLERHDVADDRPARAAEMLGLLRAWTAQASRPENRCDVVVARNRLPSEPSRMGRRLGVRYPGHFTLLGYDLERTEYEPGERIRVDFYFRVDASIDRSLFFEVLLRPPAGYPLPPHFHGGHYPMNGCLFTHDWRAGEVLRDPVEIVIPTDLRVPVEMDLVLVVRDGAARLPFEGDDRGDRVLPLGRLRFRAPAPSTPSRVLVPAATAVRRAARILLDGPLPAASTP
ncbi:MAG: sulfatase-like hydrolase/transferase [Myxococcota bacterium]|nr:sulfatase-like hydrolase/transferase [Myxococcota bacterium]MDW8361367.1 sulfatase-like hydrolase/transferase [Myxococcales bacterium]